MNCHPRQRNSTPLISMMTKLPGWNKCTTWDCRMAPLLGSWTFFCMTRVKRDRFLQHPFPTWPANTQKNWTYCPACHTTWPKLKEPLHYSTSESLSIVVSLLPLSIIVNLYHVPNTVIFTYFTWSCYSNHIIRSCNSCNNDLFSSIYIFIPDIVLLPHARYFPCLFSARTKVSV